MTLKAFTDNYADNSTEAGFQFTFFCDICNEGFKSEFVASKTRRKAGLLRGLGQASSIGGSILGRGNVGGTIDQSSSVLSERYQGMTPEWHKEHEKVFEIAQNEVKGHFLRCPKCKKWVCENDWNEQEGLCVDDAPRQNVEVAAARAQKMVTDIRDKAAATQVFTGEIESKQTLCPQCGKPSGTGKFCNSCGAPLSMVACPKCGAMLAAGTRFCGECGSKTA
jgi:hypothetical protein